MLKIAIVEDKQKEAQQLISHLDRFSQERGEALQCHWVDNAVKFLEDYQWQYDIIFMDIQMPGIDGMRAAERLRAVDSTVVLIFVTSLAQYAIQGYSVGALDYILKPVNYPALVLKLQRAITYCVQHKDLGIVISTNDGTVRLSGRQIKYVEIYNHHILYHTTQGNYSAYGTLKQVEQILPEKGFFRCNNQCIVNLSYVTKMDGFNAIVDGKTFTISRLRKKDFLKELHCYCGIE